VREGIRRVDRFIRFVIDETGEPTSIAAHLHAIWKCKHSFALKMMDPEVRRSGAYIPDTLYRRRIDVHNAKTIAFLANKITQKLWLDRWFPEHAPPVLHYVGIDTLIPLSPAAAPRPITDLPRLVRDHGSLFFKPSDGYGARGIMHVALRNGCIEVNKKPISDDALRVMAQEKLAGYLIGEVIQNAPWSTKFFDQTLNTIRILTGTYPVGRAPLILSAILKTGKTSSFPTDNWRSGKGGISAKIDIETGRVGPALGYNPAGRTRRPLRHHPETGAAITGETVPDWSAIKRLMIEVAGRLPFPGIVGWDVALTPGGIVIVEGNGIPGIDIHEAHESLISNADQKAFWKTMDIVSP
jgi:hypothetical protein